jgi:MFS family permease
MLFAETPSGILADRWSRKGVLIIASIALALCSLIGGLSYSVLPFLIATASWAIFFAMYSGTYDSIVYDTIKEQKQDSSRYDYYFGKIQLMDSIALITGSVAGGLIGTYFGLRFTFLVTVPASLISIVALTKFKEPKLHRAHQAVPLRSHITNTYRSVVKNKQLLPVLFVLIGLSVLMYTLFEFSQLWLIALLAPTVAYGPINALVMATIGAGGFSASKFKLYKLPVMMGAIPLMITSSLGLIVSRLLPITVICILILSTCFVAINIVFSRLLHDSLDSSVRAGSASAVSTLGIIGIIPVALLIGYLANTYDIFNASWILFIIVLVTSFLIIRSYKENKKLPELSVSPTPITEIYVK